MGEFSDPEDDVELPFEEGQLTDEEIKALLANQKRKAELYVRVLEASKLLGAEPSSNSKYKPRLTYTELFRHLDMHWRRGFASEVWDRLSAMEKIAWEENGKPVWVYIQHATG